MDAVADTPPASRRITIRSAVMPAGVEISVRDTGTGLPAEIIGTLFTPFVTTKSHGLGIGLTIAQRIVDAHAGAIAAADNGNGGATFTVTLPRRAVEDASRSFHRDRGIDSARPSRRPQPGRQHSQDEQGAGDDERDRIPRLNLEQKTRHQPSGSERAD